MIICDPGCHRPMPDVDKAAAAYRKNNPTKAASADAAYARAAGGETRARDVAPELGYVTAPPPPPGRKPRALAPADHDPQDNEPTATCGCGRTHTIRALIASEAHRKAVGRDGGTSR